MHYSILNTNPCVRACVITSWPRSSLNHVSSYSSWSKFPFSTARGVGKVVNVRSNEVSLQASISILIGPTHLVCKRPARPYSVPPTYHCSFTLPDYSTRSLLPCMLYSSVLTCESFDARPHCACETLTSHWLQSHTNSNRLAHAECDPLPSFHRAMVLGGATTAPSWRC